MFRLTCMYIIPINLVVLQITILSRKQCSIIHVHVCEARTNFQVHCKSLLHSVIIVHPPLHTHTHTYTHTHTRTHTHTYTAPGLELATELASAIEPLTLVCSAPLHQINGFFTSLTSVHLNFDPIIPAVNESSTPKHRSRSTTPISIPGGHRPYRRSFSEKQAPSQVGGNNKSEHKSMPEDKKLTQVPSLDSIILGPESGKECAHESTSTVTKGFKSQN